MMPRHLRLGEAVRTASDWVDGVFITDLHLQTFRGAEAKFNLAISDILEDPQRPDVILMGGDTVMNTVTCDLDRAQAQWDVWAALGARFEDIPILAAIGNQDTWGWNRKESHCTGGEPHYGKALAMGHLGMEKTSGLYKLGAWNVFVLDPIEEGGRYGFTTEVSAEQLCQLKDVVLEQPTAPLLILSHLPAIPTPGDFLGLDAIAPNQKGEWVLPGNQILSNGYDLLKCIGQGSGPRVYLCGHTHMPQMIDFLGIKFVSGPAICGAWWRGPLHGTQPGYARLRLGPQGEFDCKMVSLNYDSVSQ